MKLNRYLAILAIFLLIISAGVTFADDSTDEGSGTINYDELDDGSDDDSDDGSGSDSTDDDSTGSGDDSSNTVSLTNHATANPIVLLLIVLSILGVYPLKR